MTSFFKGEVLGYLGKSPEVKFDDAGKAICRFSLGVTEKGKEGDTTQWVNVTVWGKTGENCGQYLGQGDQALVHGRITVREYTHNNEKRFSIDCAADSVTFLSKKADRAGKPPQPGAAPF